MKLWNWFIKCPMLFLLLAAWLGLTAFTWSEGRMPDALEKDVIENPVFTALLESETDSLELDIDESDIMLSDTEGSDIQDSGTEGSDTDDMDAEDAGMGKSGAAFDAENAESSGAEGPDEKNSDDKNSDNLLVVFRLSCYIPLHARFSSHICIVFHSNQSRYLFFAYPWFWPRYNNCPCH